MKKETSKVYVLPDSHGYITRIDGGHTIGNIKDFADWILIDEGIGDKYNLCQGNYFTKPIMTNNGAYRYKLVDSRPVECTNEEILEQERNMVHLLPPTLESRVSALEDDAIETREVLELILLGATE